MKIEKILAGIRQSQTGEKVASVSAPAEKVASTTAAPSPLTAALNAALEGEKVASEAPRAASPVEGVLKIAADLEEREKEAELKHVEMLGRAFSSAAAAGFNEWAKAAALVMSNVAPVKLASADPEFDKFASENPELMREAAVLGYALDRAGLEKMANDAFARGYDDAVVEIHKSAAYEFMKAAHVAGQLLDAHGVR